ncbi:hypothetical protein [Streptomyces tauricus]|uniref:hypothetical protein n=1 Tax=Streptomyces tauricus TaxID=68274 RepID=UPI0033BB08B4
MTLADRFQGVRNWAERALTERDDVISVEVTQEGSLLVTRNGKRAVRLNLVSVPMLDEALVEECYSSDPAIDAVVNSGKELHYSGKSKERAHSLGLEAYTFKEAWNALGRQEFRGYEPANLAYAKNTLLSHRRVSRIERVCESILRIHRREHPPVDIVFVDAYTLGVAGLQQTLSWHSNVDAIVNMGAYNHYTGEAKDAATGMGIGLFTYKEFMGALNYADQRFLDYTPPQ